MQKMFHMRFDFSQAFCFLRQTPTSKTLDYLEKIIPALTFICDPSVLKGSDVSSRFLLVRLGIIRAKKQQRTEARYRAKRLPT